MTTLAERPAVTRHLMLIAGEAAEASDGRFIEIENPARKTPMAEVPRATDVDVDRAVRVAATAFESWRMVAPRDRGRALLKIADAVEAEVEAIARTVALRRATPFARRQGPKSRARST